MNRFFRPLFAIGALALSLYAAMPVAPADAATYTMCRTGRPGVAGPARETAPGSGTAYSLDGRGCARIAAADFGDFLAKGFTVASPLGTVAATTIITSASGNYVDVPGGATIIALTVEETSGFGITGGVKIGTSNGGSQVSAGIGVNASGATTSSGLLKSTFSRTDATRIYVDCVNSCTPSLSGAALNLVVIYGYFN